MSNKTNTNPEKEEECKHPDCNRPVSTAGYCDTHYRRSRKNLDMDAPIRAHTKSNPLDPKRGSPCKHEGCDRPVSTAGYCSMHYRRFKKGIDMDEPVPFIRYPIGSKRAEPLGYVSIKISNKKGMDKKNWMLEHRYIMSNHIGRPLYDNEIVHHINGIRTDNRIKNLELCKKFQPPGQRVSDMVDYSVEVLNDYGSMFGWKAIKIDE